MISSTLTRTLSAALVMAAAGSGNALSPHPPLPVEQLEAFYEAMNGDDWQRNEGWLDPEVDVCDWYGITCIVEGGMLTRIGYIRLPNNNLSGELPPKFLETAMPSHVLDLSRNAISGNLPILPSRTPVVRLTDNELTGPLPAFGEDAADGTHELHELNLAGNAITGGIPESWTDLASLTRLNLSSNLLDGDVGPLFIMPGLEWLDVSHNLINTLPESMDTVSSPSQSLLMRDNRLAGALPEWWHLLSLRQLDLGHNELSGSIDRVLEAMTREQRVAIRIDHNQFEGPLPESLLELSFQFFGTSDFCWNRFADLDPDLLAIIDDVQDGGNLLACTLREFVDRGPEISGSWFYPERSGEGYSLMRLDNGALMAYWFGYPQPRFPSEQEWFFGVGEVEGHQAIIERMHRTRSGRFGVGLGEDGWINSTAIFHDIRTVVDDQLLIYTSWPHEFYDIVPSPLPPPMTDRQDFLRLSEIAGTRCDNQHAGQWISGAWYDPDRSGEGFIVEIHGSGQGLVYWFTHTPDDTGHHAWMMGLGTLEGNTLVIDGLHQPVGGGFRPDFVSEAVELHAWGSLVMTFDDELNGHVWFDSVDENYGSGDYPIERLARPMLAECE